MLKKLLCLIFGSKDSRLRGKCKEVSQRNIDFFYFTPKSEGNLEKFIGDNYDYDFVTNGVIVWNEALYEKCGIFKSYYFPYNSYVMKADERLYCISENEFSSNYEIT